MRKESLPFSKYNMIKVKETQGKRVYYVLTTDIITDKNGEKEMQLSCSTSNFDPKSFSSLDKFFLEIPVFYLTANAYGSTFAEIFNSNFKSGEELVWFKNEKDLLDNLSNLKVNQIGIYYPGGLVEFVVSYINNCMDGIYKDYFLDEFGCTEYDEIVDYYGLVMGSEDDDTEILICEGDNLANIKRTAEEIFDRLLQVSDDEESQINFIEQTIYEKEYE